MTRRSTLLFTLLSACILGCQSLPASDDATTGSRAPSSPELNYEGLQEVRSRRLDIAQVRPGVAFSAYSGLLLSEPELAFRTPDRSRGEFPLSESQKSKFRGLLADAFRDALGDLKSLDIVAAPGPDVLMLDIRVVDIGITVSDEALSGVGRAQIGVRASADATVVLELRDAQSGELLARGVDTRSVEGAAIPRGGENVTAGFDTADKVVRKWARAARVALDSLTRER